MRVSRKTLPLKVHYFLFIGSLAPMLPFLMVVGMQLGVPVQVQGSINALILILMVFMKPLIAAAADSFPAFRKAIFLLLITITASSFSAIWLIEPFSKAQPQSGSLQGRLLQTQHLTDELSQLRIEKTHLLFNNASDSQEKGDQGTFFMPSDGGILAVGAAPPRLLTCRTEYCSSEAAAGPKTPPCWTMELLESKRVAGVIEGSAAPVVYQLTHVTGSQPAPTHGEMRLQCHSDITGAAELLADQSYPRPTSAGPDWRASPTDGADDHCDTVSRGGTDTVWGHPAFYFFCLLMLVAVVASSTTNSITDAICLDNVGTDGNYGAQRAWGSVGWGAMGLLSGALVDWWSADSPTKDYTPAFLLLLILGAADVAVSALTLKVPKLEENPAVWRNVAPLLKQPRIVLFLLFVVLNGCMDGIVANFIFVLQEEMAACTPAMQYIKLLQGLTLVVQSGAEIPFMFLCDRLCKRYGPERLTTVVFGAYGVRLLFLSLMGYLGNVWLTLLAEALNGPCFGLGYTAIVLYAGQISPPGTSATVQSSVGICYEAVGYALSSVVGGLLIQKFGGSANYLIFGLLSCLVCPLHWAFTTAYPAPTKRADVTDTEATGIPGSDMFENTTLSEKGLEEMDAMMPKIQDGSTMESN